MPTLRQQIDDSLERLDYAPPGAMLIAGLGVGLALGLALFFSLALPWAAAAFVALLVGGTLLGRSGASIEVESLLDDEEEPPAERFPEPPHRVTPRDLWVDLEGGTFRMGSPDDEEGRYEREGPVHDVAVSAFQMMRVPVTRRLYQEIIGEDPGWPEAEDSADRPVNNITWFQAVRFCNALSDADGLEPCYEELPGDKVRWHRKRDGYRLPTEAEWEYACRAGTPTRFSFGDDEAELERYAWFDKNSEGQPRPVGQKEPNPWGLHDLHGNVWEWCWDWYGPYSRKKIADPGGPDDRSPLRQKLILLLSRTKRSVLRGGSFWYVPRFVRSAGRDGGRPGFSGWSVGFRCVRGAHPQLAPLLH